MQFERSAGILLHPTSLPGNYGIGDLGNEAYKFIDFLVEAGQKLWQVFPLGPTGYGDSPYQCFSAFAGNPLLVSPEKLKEDGFLSEDDLKYPPESNPTKIDYGQVIDYKKSILKKAYDNFKNNSNGLYKEFDNFCNANKEWLDDFALFMACKEHHGGAVWSSWEKRTCSQG
jgi:4-alpha-glucanotransferase